MAKIKLVPGTRYQVESKVFEVQKILFGGQIQVQDLGFGITHVINEEEIKKALFDGKLHFEVKGRQTKNDHKLLRSEYQWGDFSLIPEQYRQVAWERYLIVKEVLKVPEEKKKNNSYYVVEAAKEAIKKLNEQDSSKRKVPSRSQIYLWVKFFKESGGDLRSLIPSHSNKGNKGEPRLELGLNSIVEAVIDQKYMTEQRPSCHAVYEEIINRVGEENKFRLPGEKLGVASYSCVWSRINKQDPYEEMAARFGKRKADQEFGDVQPGVKVSRILERVEFDSSQFPFMVVDTDDRLPIGRPTVTYCLDRYSGYPSGFYVGFEPTSYQSVMYCLLHSITPKNYVKELYPEIDHTWDSWGLPDELVVDNGKEFVGKDLEFACAQLGISLQHNPVRTPWFKPSIERHFRTINQQLLNNLPGATFANIFDRGDYDPVKNAVISFDEFLRILHIWLIDIYAQKFNKGVKGIPAKLWANSKEFAHPGYPPSKEELYVLLSKTESRNIGRRGIELFGLYYNAPELLSKLRSEAARPEREKEKFVIKYNPSDLSTIYIYDHFFRQAYLEIPAVDQEYTKNLSFWKHKIIRNLARKESNEVDIFALAKAKAKIQKIVDHEWSETRKIKSRKALARYKQIGSQKLLESEGEIKTPSEVAPIERPIIAAINDQDDPYNGISNFNALNIEQGGYNSTQNPEIIADEDEGAVSQVLPISKKTGKNSTKSKRQKANEKTSSTNLEQISDDLDLSGWEVGYDLNKAGGR